MKFSIFNIFRRKKEEFETQEINIILTTDKTSKTIFEKIQDLKSEIEIKLNKFELLGKLKTEISSLKQEYKDLIIKGDRQIELEKDKEEIKLHTYNSETYRIELETFLYKLEILEKKISFLTNIENYKIDKSNLDLSIKKILELKIEYSILKNDFSYKEQNEFKKFLGKTYYEIIKEELIKTDNSNLFNKLDITDKREVNLVFLEELKEYTLSDIKEFLKVINIKEFLKVINSTINKVKHESSLHLNGSNDLEVKKQTITNKKIVSDKRIKCDEFERLTGVSPLPIFSDGNEKLREYDISCVIYDDKYLTNANLSYTNAIINPQKVSDKSLRYVNLEGVDLSQANFQGVDIFGANLKNTNAIIDPQLVKNKTLTNCNLEGLDLSNVSFQGVYIAGANLNGTRANLEGAILVDTKRKSDSNRIFVSDKRITCDEFERLTGVSARPLFRSDNEKLREYDISCVIYDDRDLTNINLSYTNAIINPQKVMDKSLKYADLEGIDLSQANFQGVNITGANLKNTGAKLIGAINNHQKQDDEVKVNKKR